MITTLEKAPIGMTGTLVEEIWNLGEGEEVMVCATAWNERQEMKVQVVSNGVTYHLPYYVKIDDGQPNTLGELLDQEAEQDEWVPGRWWQVVAPDDSLWAETSNEAEARRMVREGDKLYRQMVRKSERWEEVK